MYESFIGIHYISISNSHLHELDITLHFVSSLHFGLPQIFIVGSQGISAYSWGTFRIAVILISEQTVLLLPRKCLARSNTKWVGRRYCYSCIRNDCSNVLLNSQLEKSDSTKCFRKKKYTIPVSSIVCWVNSIWKEIFKVHAQDQSNLLEQLKIHYKIDALLPFTKQTHALGFVISVLLQLYCGLTTKPAQALKQSNNKAQQVFICATGYSFLLCTAGVGSVVLRWNYLRKPHENSNSPQIRQQVKLSTHLSTMLQY